MIRRNKKSSLIILGILFINCVALSQEIKQNKKDSLSQWTEGWNIVDDARFEVKYPPDWELSKNQQGSEFVLLSKLSSTEDVFRENVNLVIQDLAEMNIDLDKYLDITINQIKTMVLFGEVWENERIKTDNDEFHRLVYSGKFDSTNLKFEQYIWIRSEKAYVITLTCAYKEFYDYLGIGQLIFDSFNLKVR